MKVKFKLKGKPVEVNYNAAPHAAGRFALRPASQKDWNIQQELIAETDGHVIRKGILQVVEKKLGIPIDIDYDYQGSGFGLKIDMYSLMSKLK